MSKCTSTFQRVSWTLVVSVVCMAAGILGGYFLAWDSAQADLDQLANAETRIKILEIQAD